MTAPVRSSTDAGRTSSRNDQAGSIPENSVPDARVRIYVQTDLSPCSLNYFNVLVTCFNPRDLFNFLQQFADLIARMNRHNSTAPTPSVRDNHLQLPFELCSVGRHTVMPNLRCSKHSSTRMYYINFFLCVLLLNVKALVI